MNYFTLNNILSKINNSTIQIISIGKSVLGNNIYAVLSNTQNNLPWAIITGGIHAREHLSTDLIVALIHDYINRADLTYNVAFVPLINPDGANIATNGVADLSKKMQQKLYQINGLNNFSLYKANANGIDLNNNFDANWNNQFTNKTQPSSQGYYGEYPFSEPETCAIRDFTKKLKPFITISYHLKGEEIYFDFFQSQNNYKRDYKIAQIFAQSTHYKIKSTQHGSSGGYKDWCVQTLKIPALTIELGSDAYLHPYPISQLANIYNNNKQVFDCLTKALQIYNLEKDSGIYDTSAKTSKQGI